MPSSCALAAFAAQKSAVVLDARLALKGAGLAFASALAGGADVWFSREFVSLINPAPDDTGPPPLPGPHDTAPDFQETVAEGTEMWRTAYANGRTLGRFCWMGDTPAESASPVQARPGLVATFDALIHTLNPGFDLGWSPFVTCGLQSLAIAASLSADIPVIFTAAAEGEAPALCRDAESAGISHHALPEPSALKAAIETQFGRPINLASLAGADVAALWLVAPRASLVANADYPAEYVPERFRLTLAECLPWAGARIYWTTFQGAADARRPRDQ
jgi:hypothetical protein